MLCMQFQLVAFPQNSWIFHIGLYPLIFPFQLLSLLHDLFTLHGQGRCVYLRNYHWDLAISVFCCCNKAGFYFLRKVPVGKFCDDQQIISGFIVLHTVRPLNFFYDKIMFHILHFFLYFFC